ncbi:MAG: NAD(P)-binding protein, partial [Candidatus Micrarchaeota archaeon]|nr:NAD(P)-binding protein [Candidatus Micrarchaeota archaeon]
MVLFNVHFETKLGNDEKVIVVGAGISGLMDAFALSQADFAVSVYAKGSDPRKNSNWQASQSSTLGGEA